MIIIVLYYLHVHMQWSGIVTNWYSEFAGLQFKVQTSGKIREHFEVSPDIHNFNYTTLILAIPDVQFFGSILLSGGDSNSND